MKSCEKSGDNFNAIELSSIFLHLPEMDFNDSYYIELAKLNKWKIVTDDHDFVNCSTHSLEVITYN